MACCAICQSALREYAGRQICDGCGAMLIPHGDFVESIGGDVRVVDDTPTERVCPRCDGKLRACRVTVDGVDLDHDTLHCKRDGVWLAGGMLEDVLEELGRERHRDPPSGITRGAGGGGLHGRWGTGVPSGTTFTSEGGASGGERFWFRRRLARPLVPTKFTSAFRELTLTCSRCSIALEPLGDRYGCATCGGVFVETAALVEMIECMTGAPWQYPGSAGSPGVRGCPVCARRMDVEPLERVLVDRCVDHGVWFDREELAEALLATVK